MGVLKVRVPEQCDDYEGSQSAERMSWMASTVGAHAERADSSFRTFQLLAAGGGTVALKAKTFKIEIIIFIARENAFFIAILKAKIIFFNQFVLIKNSLQNPRLNQNQLKYILTLFVLHYVYVQHTDPLIYAVYHLQYIYSWRTWKLQFKSPHLFVRWPH